MDDYLDSPLDADEVFPCKGCGEILEEGKAFELAGKRWHLDCFRCNTCGTLLDSDANLLLLGDGSLICNNCTYSCSACGNKIEDLAILTGDQAFCATCFRCRNCKRKIENLRYARTSQGIFCMSCHESLMARRRKKTKAAAQAKVREKESPRITDKSLPALPPNALPPSSTFSNDRADLDSDTPTELSPPPPSNYPRNEPSARSEDSRPDRSPDRVTNSSKEATGLGLQLPSYRNNRNSSILIPSGESGPDADSFFIPVVLDPSPAPTPRPAVNLTPEPPKKSSRERPPELQAAPHIAFQEKGRKSSSDYEQQGKGMLPPPRGSKPKNSDAGSISKTSISADERSPRPSMGSAPPEEFKLQDVPKNKKILSSRGNSQTSATPSEPSPAKGGSGTLSRREKDGLLGDRIATPRSSTDSRRREEDDPRAAADAQLSARPDLMAKTIARKELPTSASKNVAGNGKGTLGQASRASSSDEAQRPSIPDRKGADKYRPTQTTAPTATRPESSAADDNNSGNDTVEPKLSPKLPRWSSGGPDFCLDEDMARILGTDEGSSSILRRVSNAVRHGRTNSSESASHHHAPPRVGHARSVSETTRGTASPRWPKTPIVEDPNGHLRDISSPLSFSSPGDDPAFLKRQLRNSEQRVAELERQFNSEKDLKNLNKKLVEKRKTVSVLDTQTEIMIRQLEVLAGYVERAKEMKTQIDPRELEDSAIKEFVQKLERVKLAMAAAIEQLHEERDQLVEEKNQAIADRDRALLEFEQLSSKNAQLADMNNDLTHQIQERFKSQIDPKSPNGLTAYAQQAQGFPVPSSAADGASINTATTLTANDLDEHIIETGPTVVNIRKGQVKKFNWKKGSKTIAQNVTKGVNRAVVAFQQDRDRNQLQGQHQGLTGDNIGLPYNLTVAPVDSPVAFASNGQGTAGLVGAGPGAAGRVAGERQGFGFFKKNTLPKSFSTTNVSTPTIAEAPTTLFGSDLSERADFERRQIPSVVTRCIEEVELRGMDVEGIYRKTGGNSLVKMVQDGFEKNEDYDISDPSIDITAVTSVLKQYFRKLPTPLLTFDVYERILESNAVVNESDRCAHLRKTFDAMPQQHRDCLEFLMFHLARVAKREPENLMSPKNLAVVFAPTIMRDHSLEREMTDMHAKNIAVQFVIENSDLIFTD